MTDKKATTRIYLVTDKAKLNQVSLVRAYNRSAARNFIAARTITAEVADQDTLVNLIGGGAKVEDATAPETVDAFEPEAKTGT